MPRLAWLALAALIGLALLLASGAMGFGPERQPIAWGDRVHHSPAELSAWLEPRGGSYELWALQHPEAAAMLEGRATFPWVTLRTPPVLQGVPASRATLAGTALAFGVALVVVLVVGASVALAGAYRHELASGAAGLWRALVPWRRFLRAEAHALLTATARVGRAAARGTVRAAGGTAARAAPRLRAGGSAVRRFAGQAPGRLLRIARAGARHTIAGTVAAARAAAGRLERAGRALASGARAAAPAAAGAAAAGGARLPGVALRLRLGSSRGLASLARVLRAVGARVAAAGDAVLGGSGSSAPASRSEPATPRPESLDGGIPAPEAPVPLLAAVLPVLADASPRPVAAAPPAGAIPLHAVSASLGPAAEAALPARDEPPDPHEPEHAGSSPAPAADLLEECEIRIWHGYVKSQFYAVSSAGGGTALAASPLFRRAGDLPREEPKVLAAHEALVRRLVDGGWEPDGEGEAWYARRFRRSDAYAGG